MFRNTRHYVTTCDERMTTCDDLRNAKTRKIQNCSNITKSPKKNKKSTITKMFHNTQHHVTTCDERVTYETRKLEKFKIAQISPNHPKNTKKAKSQKCSTTPDIT